MKTLIPLVLTGLFGVVPFVVLPFEALIGLYAVAGTAGLAIYDYRRANRQRHPLEKSRRASPAERKTANRSGTATWAYQTVSA